MVTEVIVLTLGRQESGLAVAYANGGRTTLDVLEAAAAAPSGTSGRAVADFTSGLQWHSALTLGKTVCGGALRGGTDSRGLQAMLRGD